MDWDRKSLVHGDAYPGNVLVDDDGEVATILDFGRYSLVGDPRLDAAIAIELTEMVADFTPEDTEYLRGLTDEEPAAAAYRAWTAIVLASVYRGDSRIVRKCIREPCARRRESSDPWQRVGHHPMHSGCRQPG